jgi:beta-glucanase (GH16 family)
MTNSNPNAGIHLLSAPHHSGVLHRGRRVSEPHIRGELGSGGPVVDAGYGPAADPRRRHTDTDNLYLKGWPTAGEIDIMEFIGREPDHIYATVHAPGYSGGNGVGSSVTTSAETLRNDFHVYAIEWEENEIRWYFDDQQYFKITPDDVPDQWIFDHPFFITLNLAVGGGWPGYPDDTTEFPQFLYVDYVRVYQKP